MSETWPADPARLERLQTDLAGLRPEPWAPTGQTTVGGCFVCFARGGCGPGEAGDRGWAAAVVMSGRRLLHSAWVTGHAGAPYKAGYLAAREGPILEAAVRELDPRPEVVLVNATGRDHPRRAGLALHLGWALDLPTVGLTHRPLLAAGPPPGPTARSASPLSIEDDQVGWWLRTRSGARAVALSPGWRFELDSALALMRITPTRVRTVEPIRQARRLARTARSQARD